MMRTLLAGLICLVAATGSAWGQAAAEVGVYQRALLLLDLGDENRAVQILARLRDEGTDRAVREASSLVLGQIGGVFKERLEHFEAKAHGDFVVLVADEAAALEAIRGWKPGMIWPVLIEDAWWTPLFIRAYEPKRVYRWSPEREGIDAEAALIRIAERHNRRFGADDYAAKPPGLVAIDPTGPQRVAGVALAMAYQQPIWLHESEHRSFKTMIDSGQAEVLRAAFAKALDQHGLNSAERWSGLTLAGEWPYRYRVEGENREIYCTDDLLGRDGSGRRVAVCGRLIGDETMSLYQAMSSLFLRPRHALVFDDYVRRGKGFDVYRLRRVTEGMAAYGEVTAVPNEKGTSIAHFRTVTRNTPYEMVWLNSSGLSTNFDVTGWGRALDLPIGRASAWHVIHSFSLADPLGVVSVGGRVMRGGGYWYMGSVHEPYLTGFVTPTQVWSRASRGTPLAMATRVLPGHPMSKPWKIMVIGDPLWRLREGRVARSAAGWPEDAREYVPDRDGKAIEMLVYRWAWDLEIDAALLKEAIDGADGLSGDELDLVMYLLSARRDWVGMGRVPNELLAENTLARNLTAEGIGRLTSQQLRDGELVEASRNVVRLSEIVEDRVAFQNLLTHWATAMDAAGQETKATALLRAIEIGDKTSRMGKLAAERVLGKRL